jgi:hypothetical protein
MMKGMAEKEEKKIWKEERKGNDYDWKGNGQWRFRNGGSQSGRKGKEKEGIKKKIGGEIL